MIDKRTVYQAETLKCKHACETLFCSPKFKFHWGLHSVYILYRRLDTCILKKIMKLKQNSLIMHGQNTLHNGFAKFWSEFLCEIQKSDDDCKLYWTTSTLSAKAGFCNGRVNQQIITSLKRVRNEHGNIKFYMKSNGKRFSFQNLIAFCFLLCRLVKSSIWRHHHT